MTIIGVTDERLAKVKTFLKSQKIDYPIAIGGAEAFRTRGIPHAWLISPEGKIVWNGHPQRLDAKMIKKYLPKG